MKFWQRNEYWKYASFIRETETSHGIPENMLAILLYQSSEFQPRAIQSQNRHKFGSIGIANIMHDVGRRWGLVDEKGRDMRYDPFASIRAAGAYLAKQKQEFGSWRRAVIAYKWGSENLRVSLHAERSDQFPIPAETMDATERLAQELSL